MSGQLDQISLAIGGLQADTASLTRTLTKHCDDDESRHREIMAALADYREHRAEARGMGRFGRAVWVAFLGIGGLVAGWFGHSEAIR